MKPKYNNILIDAVMHLGDLIHATTLIPLLKQQYPDARISNRNWLICLKI